MRKETIGEITGVLVGLGILAYLTLSSELGYNPLKWDNRYEEIDKKNKKVVEDRRDIRYSIDSILKKASLSDGIPGMSFQDQVKLANDLGFYRTYEINEGEPITFRSTIVGRPGIEIMQDRKQIFIAEKEKVDKYLRANFPDRE